MAPQFLIVSPFRGAEKHPANPIAIEQRFLNFGALSLASFLARLGWETRVYDEYVNVGKQNTIQRLTEDFGNDSPLLIGVSVISAYSADRVQDLLHSLKATWPGVPIAIGGQHFVGYWTNRFKEYMPDADMLVAGEAESAIADILTALKIYKKPNCIPPSVLPSNVFLAAGHEIKQGQAAPSMRLPLDDLVDVDYGLYPGSTSLFPSVEFSRGCPFSCVFCSNSRENRLGYRRVSDAAIRKAIVRLLQTRSERPLQFYMQASNFSVTLKEAESLAAAIPRDELQWRTEIRVDGLEDGCLEILASAGLKVLDLGLESASIETLKIMRKTVNPSVYLEHASKVLSDATDNGIFTKVNYLIHPGDTYDTVEESWRWLRSHHRVISGISSGVAMEYPGTPISTHFADYESKYGTTRVDHPLSHWGVYSLNPSRALSLKSAEQLATKISQSMQTRAEFARSKAFGYLGSSIPPERLLESLPEASHETPYRD